MNGETKRRIDNARDVLVGKVPDPKGQVEQITLALMYRFMDNVDQISEDVGGKARFFANGYEKYAWGKLMDARQSGIERLLLYAEAIEKMSANPHLPQLFRDMFKGAFLPYRDPETLRLFLKEIESFPLEHTEELGDAYEYLLSILSSQGDAGQFRTPRHIIKFIVDVVDPKKDETVLDPACGTAGFLIDAYQHIVQANTKDTPGDLLTSDDRERLAKNFAGYDISPDMVRMSLVNMYLHGFAHPRIHEYDTLTDEARWEERFDVILANPPFMTPKGGIRPHKRFSVQANRSEVLFVDYIAEHLTPSGRAGVIVPEGIIFQSSNAYKALRKMLVDDCYLWAVVSLPAGVFNPYAGVKTSILFMDREFARRSDEILFVNVQNDGFDLGAQRHPVEANDLPAALEALRAHIAGQSAPGEDPGSLALTALKARVAGIGDYNLSSDRHRKTLVTVAAKCPVVTLGDLVQVEFGTRITKRDSEGTLYPVYGGGGTSFRTDTYTHEGALVVARFALSPCCVRLVREPFHLLDSGLTVAIKPDMVASANQDYLHLQLLHMQQAIYACARGHAQKNLDISAFLRLAIPLPPLDVQQQIVDEIEGYQKVIDGARQVVENWKPSFTIDPSWPVVRLGEVASVEYGYTASACEEGDARFIRITDITEAGTLRDDGVRYIALNGDARRYLLTKGDVLVARTGATFGKTLLFDSELPSVFASFLVRLRFPSGEVLPAYYWAFSQTEPYWAQARSLVTGGAQPQFNGNAIKEILLPVPPLEVQQETISAVRAEQLAMEACRALITTYEARITRRLAEVWGKEA